VIAPFDVAGADLFRRSGLTPSASPLPVWDLLLPVLLALILLDVATRRIAWDYQSIRRAILTAQGKVREFTTARKVESRQTLDALKRVRDEVAEQKLKPGQPQANQPKPPSLPDAGAKFEATEGVKGDLSQVVGGATDKPLPPAPKNPEPKGLQGDAGHTGSLLEAKRRAQQRIREKEKGEG
jgi:hypothetical protein